MLRKMERVTGFTLMSHKRQSVAEDLEEKKTLMQKHSSAMWMFTLFKFFYVSRFDRYIIKQKANTKTYDVSNLFDFVTQQKLEKITKDKRK